MRIEFNLPDAVVQRVANALNADPTPESLGPAISRLLRQTVFAREDAEFVRTRKEQLEETLRDQVDQERNRRRGDLGI